MEVDFLMGRRPRDVCNLSFVVCIEFGFSTDNYDKCTTSLLLVLGPLTLVFDESERVVLIA